MATSRDAPNPLRPYYIPPSIGLPPDPAANGSTKSLPVPQSSGSSFGTQARDILSDLDYGDYLSDHSPSLGEMAKKLMDQAVWNYTSVLLAQPFEVAKIVLQCHLAGDSEGAKKPSYDAASRRRSEGFGSGKFEEYPSDDNSDDDMSSYFSSSTPNTAPFSPSTSRRHRRPYSPTRSDSSTPTPAPLVAPHILQLARSDSLLEVLGQLWTKESAWGIWKGTNSTFVYNFLLKTIETWTRSLLSALLNVPDPGLGTGGPGAGGLDVMESANPLASLAVAVAAAAIAGVALSPLDLVRTRLIITPTSSTPRAILPSLRVLPSLTVPSSLLPITILHSSLPPLISASTPLVLRTSLRIDPVLTPTTYSICSFLSSLGELFIRLPLETVLRRGQVAVLKESAKIEAYTTLQRVEPEPSELTEQPWRVPATKPDTKFKTVVDVGPYKGVLGTMWYIVREEGMTSSTPLQTPQRQGSNGRVRQPPVRVRKGQGIQGLWRGWRVGFWGIVGVWGAAALGSGGGEF